MPASDLQLLLFNLPHGKYKSGDIAGFPPHAAQRILGLKKQQADDDGRLLRNYVPVAVTISRDRAEASRKPSRSGPATFPVKFTSRYGPYRVGEVAGFPKEVVDKLVNGWNVPQGRKPPVAVHYKMKDDEKKSEPVKQEVEAAVVETVQPIAERKAKPRFKRRRLRRKNIDRTEPSSD